MTAHSTRTGLQLRSLVRANGQLELSLVSVPVPDPLRDEVLVRIEASPLNPVVFHDWIDRPRPTNLVRQRRVRAVSAAERIPPARY